ncbi:hypothetical protein IIA28_06970 [candidate division KSB1 bacterium]|nr:hypothetical protein [candidate division KSB1 bacterium]
MKSVFYSTITLFVLFFVACDFPSPFSGGEQQTDTPQEIVAPGTIFLNVDISGGFAGVQQNLQVDESGNAFFKDSLRPGANWKIQLAPAQLGDIKKLMTENDFFGLNDSYIDHRTADAFIYAISYRENDQSKTVHTDGISVPENLARIIQGILELISKVTGYGLQFDLRLSQSQINPDESVEMTLLVTNVSDRSVRLRFESGQVFDFLAVKEPVVGDGPEFLVWNWAHGKAFTLQIWTLDIQPGEAKSYQVTWDGRDNNGDALTGRFAIRAVLVSIPGGSPIQKYLDVVN